MPRHLSHGLLIVMLFLFLPSHSFADFDKTLETKFTTIHYTGEREVCDFFWRMTGKRLTLLDNVDLVKNRIDELVERVEALLDMYPAPFHFEIQLKPYFTGGVIANYSHKTRMIIVALDRVTDGVLAHEMAHAVINAYFPVSPPEKAQEILAQYVDKHLFEEPL